MSSPTVSLRWMRSLRADPRPEPEATQLRVWAHPSEEPPLAADRPTRLWCGLSLPSGAKVECVHPIVPLSPAAADLALVVRTRSPHTVLRLIVQQRAPEGEVWEDVRTLVPYALQRDKAHELDLWQVGRPLCLNIDVRGTPRRALTATLRPIP